MTTTAFGWVRLSVLRLLTETAQLLLDAGVNARGTNTPMRVASREGRFGSYEIAAERVRFYGLGHYALARQRWPWSYVTLTRTD
ncbi:hypothetical protein BJY52DRAFT_1290778 [Lactarius psammicola]|nr:hypothetical protein BJY52DRAFT_1290778 [Lactarius psammicola]